MIEFSKISARQQNKSKIKNKKKSDAISHEESKFATELNTNIRFDFEGSIDELMTDLRGQEKKFLDNQTLYELNQYKALVKKILKTIQEESLKTKTFKRPRSSNKEDFTIIEKINGKLLDLSSSITKRNDAFNLMKTLEEIRGLIFDLQY